MDNTLKVFKMVTLNYLQGSVLIVTSSGRPLQIQFYSVKYSIQVLLSGQGG